MIPIGHRGGAVAFMNYPKADEKTEIVRRERENRKKAIEAWAKKQPDIKVVWHKDGIYSCEVTDPPIQRVPAPDQKSLPSTPAPRTVEAPPPPKKPDAPAMTTAEELKADIDGVVRKHFFPTCPRRSPGLSTRLKRRKPEDSPINPLGIAHLARARARIIESGLL